MQVKDSHRELLKLADDLYRKASSHLGVNDAVRDAIPVFAVLGLQSTGKSSVLRRLSGVDFPTASKLCTKVKTQLSLERHDDHSADVAPGDPGEGGRTVRVEAVSEDGTVQLVEDCESQQEQLEKAQEVVLGDKTFSEKGFVRISVVAPDVPEVTFVDLPGIFNVLEDSEKEDCGLVRSLVEDTIKSPSAFVLHVAPVDRDVRQLATWEMVTKAGAAERSVVVFTHADKVDGVDQLLERINDVADAGTVPERIFIVDVKSASDGKEMASLMRVLGHDGLKTLEEHGVQVGCKKLKASVEDIMIDHLREKIHLLPPLLERGIAETSKELDNIGARPFAPAEALARAVEVMRGRAVKTRDVAGKLGDLTKKLGDDVMALGMRPIVRTPSETGQGDDDGAATLAAGSDSTSEPETNHVAADLAKDEKEMDWTALMRDAQAVLDKCRGERPLSLEDPYLLCEMHSRDFAEQVEPLLRNFVVDIHGVLQQGLFDEVFKTESAPGSDPRVVPACQRVINALKVEMDAHWKIALEAVRDYIASTLDCLRLDDAVWTINTTNAHYLQDSSDSILCFLEKQFRTAEEFAEERQQLETGKTAEQGAGAQQQLPAPRESAGSHYKKGRSVRGGGADQCDHNTARNTAKHLSKAYGFWKVQQKRVPDDVQNFARLSLMHGARKHLQMLLTLAPSREDLRRLVKEPGSLELKRTLLTKRLDTLLDLQASIADTLKL